MNTFLALLPEPRLYWSLVALVFAAAVVTFFALLRITAPYGRHARPGWGPALSARAGWIVMESPAVLLFVAVFIAGPNAAGLVPLVLLGMWQLHYLNRTFVYPLRLRVTGRRMPIVVIAMAIAFNCVNAWINARWISTLGTYADDWLQSPAFLAGAGLFAAGFAINQHADTALIRLRGFGDSRYRVPDGGLYRWISCPNYLGEILEWLGWAIATWSLAGLAFAVFTIANLAPRAIANHRWYRQEFPNYPPQRRALIPGIL